MGGLYNMEAGPKLPIDSLTVEDGNVVPHQRNLCDTPGFLIRRGFRYSLMATVRSCRGEFDKLYIRCAQTALAGARPGNRSDSQSKLNPDEVKSDPIKNSDYR